MPLFLSTSRDDTRLIEHGDTEAAGVTSGGFVNQKSFLFDGSNEYVTIPDHASLNFGTGDFTMSAWFKAGVDAGNHHSIVSKGTTDGENRYYQMYLLTDGKVQFCNANGVTSGCAISASTYDDSAWHNIICVRLGTNVAIYVDDSADGSATLSSDFDTDNTNTLDIAHKDGDASSYFNGHLDEVSIWDKALSASERTELYNSGTPIDLNAHSASPNLVSWWTMGDDALDDATGGTGNIQDQTGSNHGTPQNTESGDIVTDVP